MTDNQQPPNSDIIANTQRIVDAALIAAVAEGLENK